MPSHTSIDATAALARLLSDAALRARFRTAPAAVLGTMGLEATQCARLAALDADDLDRQAGALIAKRVAEVSRLLPQTFRRGGPELRERFQGHAVAWWPSGHQRHRLDAIAFAEHLACHAHPALVRRELNRLRFEQSERRFSLHWYAALGVRKRPWPGVQLLFRDKRGQVREFNFTVNA